MNLTPDNFLLLILVGGFLVIVTSAAVYTYGWAWGKSVQKIPEVQVSENYEPKKLGRRGSMTLSMGNPQTPPVKGPGFYTSPNWTPSSPGTNNITQVPTTVTMPADHTALAFEQPAPAAEWVGGYMLGLGATMGTELLDSSLYLDGLLYALSASKASNYPGILQSQYMEKGQVPSYFHDVGSTYDCEAAGETCHNAFESDLQYMDMNDGGAFAGMF